MKTLAMTWQRLVTNGETCPRCDGTHQQMQHAFDKLKEALRPLGIQPTLEVKAIDDASFRSNPAESNRIWIAGKPMEEWLGASVGSSQCCSVCGTSVCRTMAVGSTTFETIPEALIIKAGLMAAADMLDVATALPAA